PGIERLRPSAPVSRDLSRPGTSLKRAAWVPCGESSDSTRVTSSQRKGRVGVRVFAAPETIRRRFLEHLRSLRDKGSPRSVHLRYNRNQLAPIGREVLAMSFKECPTTPTSPGSVRSADDWSNS